MGAGHCGDPSEGRGEMTIGEKYAGATAYLRHASEVTLDWLRVVQMSERHAFDEFALQRAIETLERALIKANEELSR
jgi:hypothetical protein